MIAVKSWLDAKAATGRWQDALRSRVPQAAVWVLAVALGIQAAILVTRWAGVGNVVGAAPSSPSSPTRHALDVAAIGAAHLFGAADLAASGAAAPTTHMPLVLTGTIAANRPDGGLAILGPNPAKVKVYAVGDTVPGGARLHAVYDDRVLLDHDGRLESLKLLREPLGRQASLGRGSAPVERAVEHVRRLMTSNPGVLEHIIRPQPVFAGGRLSGYRVYPGTNARAFSSLGLKPGDLVTAIDGTPLNDPSRSEEIFRTLGSSSEAHVTVVRDGHKQDLVLNLARIASEADQLTTGAQGAAGSSAPKPGRRVSR